ncbi:hypothetical protein HDU76_010670 [Blyttiomyces sp. JEL0837]|nr:hypothetical protein HDU76_010670 [Blyttiomyces sp. JEL0837]
MTASASEGGDSTSNGPVNIIICGLGMVALRFIEHFKSTQKKLSAHKKDLRDFQITVFSEEPHLAYNRVTLTQYFTHQSIEKLTLRPQEWYTENNIKVHLNDPVVAIDRTSKTVTSSKGVILSYDRLVLATGSAAFVPPIPRVHEVEGVFVYRSISDVEKIIGYANGKAKAAVIGGGLLGLEAAKVCVDLGLDTFVIERNPRVLARQLDDEGSTFLIKELEKLNLEAFIGANTNGFLSSDDTSSSSEPTAGQKPILSGISLTTCTNETITRSVDLVIVATGIIPRDNLAKSSGLECHPRGGILVTDSMTSTTDSDIFAIGEVACHAGMVYGLVGPGYDMARVAAEVILEDPDFKVYKGSDCSTKLKLMGVHVGSFGDYFAPESKATALTFRDPFAGIYKRLLFSKDGKKLLGGILVGDTSDYTKLMSLTKSHGPLPGDPASLLTGAKPTSGGASTTESSGTDSLPDDSQICSCNNVTKADLKVALEDEKCNSIAALKSCTNAGTGCGGCLPLVADIFSCEMKKKGVKVLNHLCEHFSYSRRELFEIVRVLRIKTFDEIWKSHGNKPKIVNRSAGFIGGCEICKPTIASILASLWNDHVLDKPHAPLQDTNDRFLANIQRGGLYSVVPRVPGGEITPDKLIVIGVVAKKFGLYTKITGGQHMFGARRQDLPLIWQQLTEAGFESGHAYGKSLRTVKSCVGSTWCRYGRRDSVGFAIALEQRYKGIRSPHKLKGGVSGCVRECAEAQGKDFGLIATEKGYNIYVCGNGGSNPKHALLLASDVPEMDAIRIIDRFLMYYIRTADKLQRTARWLEKMEGGIEFLKKVVVDDGLGICDELEREMATLVDSYFCEWTEVVKNPERWKQFKEFVNVDEGQGEPKVIKVETKKLNGVQIGADEDGVGGVTLVEPLPGIESVEWVEERGQRRPADWVPDVVLSSKSESPIADSSFPTPPLTPPAEGKMVRSVDVEVDDEPPNVFNWKEEGMSWVDVGSADDFPLNSGVAVKVGDVQVAVFRVVNASGSEKWYATQNMCPHKRAFVLSSSIIGTFTSSTSELVPKIACPNHKKGFSLETGACVSSNEPYALATFDIRRSKNTDGLDRIELRMPSLEEANQVLGTKRWKLKQRQVNERKGSGSSDSGVDVEGYKALWEDNRSRRGKYEGTRIVDARELSSYGVEVVGEADEAGAGGCGGGGCGSNKNLEW